jgi:hexosaminidase
METAVNRNIGSRFFVGMVFSFYEPAFIKYFTYICVKLKFHKPIFKFNLNLLTMKIQHLFFSLLVCGGLASCSSAVVKQADYEVIPLPQEILPAASGEFQLNGNTVITYPKGNEAMKRNAEFLAEYINAQTGVKLKVTDEPASKNAIVLTLALASDNEEAYSLQVNPDLITLTGASEAGVFYGVQTLRKSIAEAEAGDKLTFPAVTINDYPRFAYRGAHFDVSRHFFPADSVKRFIDMLALHNINRFHWHLTDDQGWRVEIKKYPKLTEVGSVRPGTVIGKDWNSSDSIPHGGFYTQEEMKDIVAYAQERHITVIPEIDLPGHMLAALTAYPELGCTGGPYQLWQRWGVSEDVLCAGNEKTLQFITDVLEEVTEIFPSKYIHVGGDECPKVRWASCPKCQAKIKELGLKSDAKHTKEQRLQSYIINYAENFLNSKGRQIIGWDEILEGGLAPNATVMSWRGEVGGIEAARQKHQAIMTPNSYLYFDYYQTAEIESEPLAIGGCLPVERVYSYEPIPSSLTPEEASYIIGVQANLWTEYIPTFSHVEYMELPRMAALSEVQWTMPEKKDYVSFLKRLPQLIQVYKQQHYNYAKHVLGVSALYLPDFNEGVMKVVLSTVDNAPIYYTLDGTEPTVNSQLYSDTLKINSTVALKAVAIRDGEPSLLLAKDITFNKATLKPIQMLKPICERYKFKGEQTLVDGMAGGPNYGTGQWIAFQKNDMEAVVDLKELTSVEKAWVRTYVEIGEEVVGLRKFTVAVSEDGKNFKEVASESYPAVSENDKNGIYTHELTFAPVQARYVKLIAQPENSLPAWHWGKGRPGFIFVDEIGVE